MNFATTHTTLDATYTTTGQPYLSPIHGLMDKYEQILQQHRAENPDLYRMVQLRDQKEAVNQPPQKAPENSTQSISVTTTESKTHPNISSNTSRRQVACTNSGK